MIKNVELDLKCTKINNIIKDTLRITNILGLEFINLKN